MEDINKQIEKTKEPNVEIINKRKKLNFSLESAKTKPYDIEKMTGKKPDQKDDQKE